MSSAPETICREYKFYPAPPGASETGTGIKTTNKLIAGHKSINYKHISYVKLGETDKFTIMDEIQLKNNGGEENRIQIGTSEYMEDSKFANYGTGKLTLLQMLNKNNQWTANSQDVKKKNCSHFALQLATLLLGSKKMEVPIELRKSWMPNTRNNPSIHLIHTEVVDEINKRIGLDSQNQLWLKEKSDLDTISLMDNEIRSELKNGERDQKWIVFAAGTAEITGEPDVSVAAPAA